MVIYKRIRDLWKNPKKNLGEEYRQRLIAWRKEDVTVRVSKPTRLDKARAVGYRAKQGFVIIRQRVQRGGHQRPAFHKGRRPKHYSRKLSLRKSYQLICEERVQRKFANLVVLNSYYVGRDGKNIWYEVILVDPTAPTIMKDDKVNHLCYDRSRVYHGKTSAGRKVRGLRNKGKGTEKARPSRRANKRLQ